MAKLQRPAAIAILVVLDISLGALVLLASAASTMGRRILLGIYPQIRGSAATSVTYALVSIGVAVIDFILAFGLWSGRRWAWYSSLAFSMLGVATAVFTLFLRPQTGALLSLAIDLVIMYLLIQPGVQQYFAKASTQLATGSMQVTKPSVAQSP